MAEIKTRKRDAPAHRWSKDQTEELLEAVANLVKDNPEHFEKPTTQKFYMKVFEKCDKGTRALGTNLVKHKMRNLKQSFIAANTWKRQTGAGLSEQGDAKSVRDYILKLCPYWDLLEQIFGMRKNVNPTDIMDSPCDDRCFELFVEEDLEAYSRNEGDDDDNFAYSSQCGRTLKNVQKQNGETFEFNDSFQSFKQQLEKVQKKIKTRPPTSSITYSAHIQERKANVEKIKMEKQCQFDREKIEIGREKLSFEWEKKEKEHKLKKYEIDQQVDLKKLQLQQEENLAMRKLELEIAVDERLKRLELELKYNKKE